MQKAFIYDAVRTPRGKGKKDGRLHSVTSLHLAKTVLESLQTRNNLKTDKVDDVILGCVMPVGEQGANIARSAVLAAGYDKSVAGMQINRFCASGLDAVGYASIKIMSGIADFVIGGGVESMSRVPMGSDGGAIAVDPSIAAEHCIVPQGISADLIATKWDIGKDEADQYACLSHKRAFKAQEAGYFKNSIVSVKDINGNIILDHDELIRKDCTLEGLKNLKPSFAEIGENYGYDNLCLQKYPELEHIHHIHTAGNSSGIADGASAVLIGSTKAGKILDKKPRAVIKAFANIGSEPTIMLTGPLTVTEKILKQAGMESKDIDLWELNEAFASVALLYQYHFDIPFENLNVDGGAIAMGHPLGATGGMLVSTVLDQLERLNKTTALITLCIAGGMGTAMIIERT